MTTIHQLQRPTPSQVTLTRRGRVVIFLLALAAVVVVFGLGRTSAKASDTSGTSSPPAVASTTVESGESLWAVSTRLWPRSDPRDGVQALARANHLPSGAQLQAGVTLRVP